MNEENAKILALWDTLGRLIDTAQDAPKAESAKLWAEADRVHKQLGALGVNGLPVIGA